MSAEPRRIVDKATFITHYSAMDRGDTSAITANGYELTKCDLYFNGTQWHEAWRSPPNNVVNCALCLGAMEDS